MWLNVSVGDDEKTQWHGFNGVLMMCALSNAQTGNTGALNGTIADQSQAVIPNATVKVVSVATGAVRNAVSTKAGTFVIPALPPGTYTVEVSAPGFKTALFSNVVLNVTETQTLNVHWLRGRREKLSPFRRTPNSCSSIRTLWAGLSTR